MMHSLYGNELYYAESFGCQNNYCGQNTLGFVHGIADIHCRLFVLANHLLCKIPRSYCVPLGRLKVHLIPSAHDRLTKASSPSWAIFFQITILPLTSSSYRSQLWLTNSFSRFLAVVAAQSVAAPARLTPRWAPQPSTSA